MSGLRRGAGTVAPEVDLSFEGEPGVYDRNAETPLTHSNYLDNVTYSSSSCTAHTTPINVAHTGTKKAPDVINSSYFPENDMA